MVKISEAFVEITARTERLTAGLKKAQVETRATVTAMGAEMKRLETQLTASAARQQAAIGGIGIATRNRLGAFSLSGGAASAASGLFLASHLGHTIDRFSAAIDKLISGFRDVLASGASMNRREQRARGAEEFASAFPTGSTFLQLIRTIAGFKNSEELRRERENLVGTPGQSIFSKLQQRAETLADFNRNLFRQTELLKGDDRQDILNERLFALEDLAAKLEELKAAAQLSPAAFDAFKKRGEALIELQTQERLRGLQGARDPGGIVSAIDTATGTFRAGQQGPAAKTEQAVKQLQTSMLQDLPGRIRSAFNDFEVEANLDAFQT